MGRNWGDYATVGSGLNKFAGVLAKKTNGTEHASCVSARQ